jgi:hypothetical protein
MGGSVHRWEMEKAFVFCLLSLSSVRVVDLKSIRHAIH